MYLFVVRWTQGACVLRQNNCENRDTMLRSRHELCGSSKRLHLIVTDKTNRESYPVSFFFLFIFISMNIFLKIIMIM